MQIVGLIIIITACAILIQIYYAIIINPQHACAERVIVFWLSVCLSMSDSGDGRELTFQTDMNLLRTSSG